MVVGKVGNIIIFYDDDCIHQTTISVFSLSALEFHLPILVVQDQFWLCDSCSDSFLIIIRLIIAIRLHSIQ